MKPAYRWISVGILCVYGACSSDNPLNSGTRAPMDTETDAQGDSSSGSSGWSSDETDGFRNDIDWDACGEQDFSMDLLPLDIILSIDTSYSMDYPPVGQLLTNWELMRGALKRFIRSPASHGMGLGLQYFPLRRQCSVEDYANPEVPISLLPDAAETLIASIEGQRMADGTPMYPMLKGVLQYATQWALNHPTRRTIVVVATDGTPDYSCLSTNEDESNTIENVERLAQETSSNHPAVNTFVIGVGSELTALNRLSQAGNGQDAILVDMTQDDVEQALLDAFESIRRRSICEYVISEIADVNTIDFEKVNILFLQPDEDSRPIGFVNTHTGCELDPLNGWYYDDQQRPSRILLCPQTCERVQKDTRNELQIVLGCQTIIIE